ncbi:SpoIVB peptidase [Desulfotomaculum copahuensis]|uniref:SpoIVB peptidase n=1 Tax=Desulfotomaculum copahuensis TaxID=1838280 RepID=UPI001FA6D50E|nr:SpoIVB peptidase [Desulfotomaculum copahuensis]
MIPEQYSPPRWLQMKIHSELDLLTPEGKKITGGELIPGKAVPVAGVPGRLDMQYRLLGLFPLHHTVVNVVPVKRVIPGGHSIGVLLHARGVIVAGLTAVQDRSGTKVCPASRAGIASGDVILGINGRPVNSDRQLRDEISRCGAGGKPVLLEVRRGTKVFNTTVQPVLCPETGRYCIGLYIRESAAGVGTLTFYDPEARKYGALGHVIADLNTSKKIDLINGSIVQAAVQGIHPGRRGRPGEKVGLFRGEGMKGNIEKNTTFGIFGTLEKPLSNPYYRQPVPVALAYQVKRGPAEILTVLHENKIERFRIEIVQVMPQARPDGKGMVIRVTDPRLLQAAGGIIQGMSGSPIIQDGKFAGAVTHVFVNDPARGYGVQAEWMLLEAGLLPGPADIEKPRKAA